MRSWEGRKALGQEGWVVFPAGARSRLLTACFCSGQAEFKGHLIFGFLGVWGPFQPLDFSYSLPKAH